MKNYWLDRVRKKQFEYRRDFMRAISSGGSWIIDWDEVYRKSGMGKPPPLPECWTQTTEPFDFGQKD